MAIVDFKQILPVASANVGDQMPVITVNGVANRTNAYDPLWGYYLFGQSTGMRYAEDRTYTDQARFEVVGVWTVDAERGRMDNDDLPDAQRFGLIQAKYEALLAAFQAAQAAEAPADYALWGTGRDPRVIPLPDPLRDKDGNPVYARPVEVDIEPGNWPVKLVYRATLEEPKRPPRKCTVNGVPLDNAVITVTPPQPILHRKRLAGCMGEVVQCSNYTVETVEITGTLPGVAQVDDASKVGGAMFPVGRVLTDRAKAMYRALFADTIEVGVVNADGTAVVAYDGLGRADEPQFDVNWADRSVQVSIRGTR